jgi:hypothetical protein
MKIHIATFPLATLLSLASCAGGPKTDPRYPPRPAGCAVQLFRGKIASIPYDDIAHVDAICGTDIGIEECLKELKNQTCKWGGDLVYDVPEEPSKPSPDKIRFTGHVAHTRAPAPAK